MKRPRNTPSPLERDIQRAILEYLKLAGVVAVRVNSGATKVGDRYIRFNGTPGCSDILACLPDGRFAAIEVKRPGGKPTPEQISFIESIQQCHGFAWVVQSVDDIRDNLKQHGYHPP